MKKFTYLAASAVMVATMVIVPFMASAQVIATMPALYNQFGQQVNVSNTTPLAAGNYYLQSNQTMLVNYYGNGVYYNTVMSTYGGSAVNDPYGTAGVSLGYAVSAGANTNPTVPNTGAGGAATATWAILGLTGLVVVLGGSYLVYLNRVSDRSTSQAVRLG